MSEMDQGDWVSDLWLTANFGGRNLVGGSVKCMYDELIDFRSLRVSLLTTAAIWSSDAIRKYVENMVDVLQRSSGGESQLSRPRIMKPF